MDAVTKLLVTKLGGALPYDLVLPAQLGLECCFGPMIVLDRARQCEASAFAEAAGLDRPCVSRGEREVDWLSVLPVDDA